MMDYSEDSMKEALFLNGVYESVLDEIVKAQGKDPNLACYLQPHSSHAILHLKNRVPSPTDPVTMYMSVTDNLSVVKYMATIIGWEDKPSIFKDLEKLEQLNKHIEKHQPEEESIYAYIGEDDSKLCINLIAITNLIKLTNPFSVRNLVKARDDTPCKPKNRSGGWAYVYPVPDWVKTEETTFVEDYEKNLAKHVSQSLHETLATLEKKANSAPMKPQQIQIISRGFKRNSDVIAAVLKRANGICESCKSKAPFIRKKDNTPYLEVHHKKTLADGGYDTIENAMAICPNCHRKAHFGN